MLLGQVTISDSDSDSVCDCDRDRDNLCCLLGPRLTDSGLANLASLAFVSESMHHLMIGGVSAGRKGERIGVLNRRLLFRQHDARQYSSVSSHFFPFS